MDEAVVNLLETYIKNGYTSDTKRMRKRKIIFWYDETEEYKELVQELIQNNTLDNTEIIIYDNNSIEIRYHVEKEETEKNIVIYCPFKKKKGVENNLLDLESYNEDLIFNPDLTTMKLKDLNLPDDCRQIVKKYMKFFKNKKRIADFNSFDFEKDKKNIDFIVTACILNIKSIEKDDILKAIISSYIKDTKRYEDLFKLGSEEFIVNLFNETFGSKAERQEDLINVYKSLIITYFAMNLEKIEDANNYARYILIKRTNAGVFVNNLMRDDSTKEIFEQLSNNISKEFEVASFIMSLKKISKFVQSDAFKDIDKQILTDLSQNINPSIVDFTDYKDIISTRRGKYWYKKYINEYEFLYTSIVLVETVNELKRKIRIQDFDSFVKLYAEELYKVDFIYRKMYFYFDQIQDKDLYIDLKDNLERIYNVDYIRELSIKWGLSIDDTHKYNQTRLVMQDSFYNKYINQFKDKKDRIFVIISDAFRYECAKELNDKLKDIGNKSEISYMLGLVPSYTKLGKACLLPHKKLNRINDKNSDDILVDGLVSSGKEDRERIIQKEIPNSIAMTYEDLYSMKKQDWKNYFSGKKLVYIYHDVIDKTGEHDEDNVFTACEKAILEIYKMIEELSTTFSGINAFVTADHGFFYRRSKLEEWDKTTKIVDASKHKTRYSYSDEKQNEEGILSFGLDYIFDGDKGYVNVPKGPIIYKKQGTGVNYIHGGILPEEIVIPVIDFKSSRNKENSHKVGIVYNGISRKITNAITYLEFMQDNPVNEENKQCRYLVHFEDQEGNKVSDECTIVADLTDKDPNNRKFREKFVFKNIKYDKSKTYKMVVVDEETGIEKTEAGEPFYIDIAIINNFDF